MKVSTTNDIASWENEGGAITSVQVAARPAKFRSDGEMVWAGRFRGQSNSASDLPAAPFRLVCRTVAWRTKRVIKAGGASKPASPQNPGPPSRRPWPAIPVAPPSSDLSVPTEFPHIQDPETDL